MYIYIWASQVAPVVRNPTTNAGDIKDEGSIPRLGRYPGGRHGNPLQYSCLENPTDRGAWWATVHMVAESDTTEATSHTHTHIHIMAILTGVVLICISLVISGFEHLFMYQRRYTNGNIFISCWPFKYHFCEILIQIFCLFLNILS